MKRIFLIAALLISAILVNCQPKNTIHHILYVNLNPETSEVFVTDTISGILPNDFEFQLNKVFKVESKSPGIKVMLVSNNAKAGDIGMDRESENEEVVLSKWKLSGKAKSFVISYSGKLDSEIEQSKENYQRGFSQSPGIISEKGVYLAGSTWWVPVFENSLMSFKLTTTLPKDWKNVSQGERTFDKVVDGRHLDTWVCNSPQEEVFLIAAVFNEYSYDMNSGVKAMAFLRTPDEGLANKYLEVTEQYMDMYQGMIGDYPYWKFALVENFWETGYGMPSFTLLGEKIIRFPFILHSSYPHELLHNWWGNSVYVDFESGNWCEGLTAFMADHLIKEQRGAGEEYRRSTLHKFSNIVNEDNDFPLNKFLSRHDGASEAIGYGKSLMMWQMLRRKIGDDKFVEGVSLFYKSNKFKSASFDDIRIAMEEVSGMDLKQFFGQWVNRTGAPELAITDLKYKKVNDSYDINLTLAQVQKPEAFTISVPISVLTEKGLESFVFTMDKKQQEFDFSVNAKPIKLAVDPQYDVFRILNPAEVPAALSKIWGSDDNVFVLPSSADKEKSELYKKFAQQWKDTDNDNFTIVYDNEINEFPKDKAVWVLGFENKFAPVFNSGIEQFSSALKSDSVMFENKNITKTDNSFVFTMARRDELDKQDIFISIENKDAIDGLIRKLPHYGKYSYLAFSADEPTNIAKGQWPVVNSPLVKVLSDDGSKVSMIEPREALASLKPVFSENRMMASIKYLASDELKGRGLGTAELDMAADYIAGEFKSAGLQSVSDDYFQEFTHKFNGKGELKLKNIIGIIPGINPELKDEVVVLSAHYDHLGLGWPDHHAGDEGKIHAGADDNASGVAIMMELARSLAKTAKPARTIVFLAASGEEAGLIGSRHFVDNAEKDFGWKFFADVNLDTDGSLFDKKLMVLNANTAKEWKFIFMGTDYTTGVLSEVIENDLDASDQIAFIEKGIPAVQLFTGATLNYHRPSDKYETIDGKGLVKVATVTKEVILYLADREDPMLFTGKAATVRPAPVKKSSGRRVSTGTVPDFAFKGEGVKVGSVIPGSAGEKAGLLAGDIISKLDGTDAKDLRTYSVLLKNYQPGDEVSLTILRNGDEKIIKLVLGER
jgi:hypothetical protein